VLWNSKNLTKTPDKTRYSGTIDSYFSRVSGFIWCFSKILTVPEHLALSGVLVRFLLSRVPGFFCVLVRLWNSKNLTKTPDKARYCGTVRISIKHQIKPGTLEQ
jgi:apolipoprotein N-acyltransferase